MQLRKGVGAIFFHIPRSHHRFHEIPGFFPNKNHGVSRYLLTSVIAREWSFQPTVTCQRSFGACRKPLRLWGMRKIKNVIEVLSTSNPERQKTEGWILSGSSLTEVIVGWLCWGASSKIAAKTTKKTWPKWKAVVIMPSHPLRQAYIFHWRWCCFISVFIGMMILPTKTGRGLQITNDFEESAPLYQGNRSWNTKSKPDCWTSTDSHFHRNLEEKTCIHTYIYIFTNIWKDSKHMWYVHYVIWFRLDSCSLSPFLCNMPPMMRRDTNARWMAGNVLHDGRQVF